jgi:hypothetical protein
LTENLNEKIHDGAVYVQIVEQKHGDEDRGMSQEEMHARINQTLDNSENPSMKLKILDIKAVPAWANESCPDCGLKIADFGSGNTITKTHDTPARILLYEKVKSHYLKSNIPLDDLKSITESLR